MTCPDNYPNPETIKPTVESQTVYEGLYEAATLTETDNPAMGKAYFLGEGVAVIVTPPESTDEPKIDITLSDEYAPIHNQVALVRVESAVTTFHLSGFINTLQLPTSVLAEVANATSRLAPAEQSQTYNWGAFMEAAKQAPRIEDVNAEAVRELIAQVHSNLTQL